MTEGRLPFRGNEVWFRVVGDDHAKPPILLIHGGPGSTSDILEPLADLAASGRQVVFYDQLGAGRSDRTHDPALWTIDTFVDEVQAVRDHLGLDEVHLFGHSWGGMLALEYALRQPAGLRSLVLASALVSASLFAAEADRLVSDLPASWQRALARTAHQAPKTVEPRPAEPPIPRDVVDKKARQLARAMPIVGAAPVASVAAALGFLPPLRGPAAELVSMQFVRRHVFRGGPMPIEVARMIVASNNDIYRHLWGRSEFSVTGTLRDWDIRARLPEIAVPALVTGGRYDEVTPVQAEELAAGLKYSERATFEDSSHCAMLEERDLFLAVVADFLGRHDRD